MPPAKSSKIEAVAPAMEGNSFLKLLSDYSAASGQNSDPSELVRLFCSMTRQFFGASSAVCWKVVSNEELEIVAADPDPSGGSVGKRVRLNEDVVAAAVRTKRAIRRNNISEFEYPFGLDRPALSVLCVPVIHAGEVIGAVSFTHDGEAQFFNDDSQEKAVILAALVGNAMETSRSESHEERRRAEVLVQCAKALHSQLDLAGVTNALAERVRSLLNSRIVAVLLRDGDSFRLEGAAAETQELLNQVRGEYASGGCGLTGELAARAIEAGVSQIAPIDPSYPNLPCFLNEGQILVAPITTSRMSGALLVCCGTQSSFREEDKSLIGAVAGFAAIAIANAELYATAQDRARELQQLLAIALDLNSLFRIPQWVANFTERAGDMLGARAVVLALAQHSVLETISFHQPGSAAGRDKALLRALNHSFSLLTSQSSEPIIYGQAAPLLGKAVAASFGWKDFILARLTGTDGELIGVLCFADRGKELSSEDRNLLQALACHASVALENSRLFTRMEQATRHWVEIFDAITDFIVVHDESNNILRVNRSLSEFMGVRPAELIGVGMRALVSMASDGAAHNCPFCRPGQHAGDEYVHLVLDRTYLVSNSQIHGARNDGLQTIHVLKDITDRREAERRYRELFDNIQEGLFFSSPDGRFVEVNDALVRMLGYENRDELLQVNIPSQLYLQPGHRTRFEQSIEETGVLRNFEETLRRKDGSLIYCLQNAFAVRDAQGRVLQYRGLMLDITELKNFQAELQRERDFSSKVLNNTQSLILVADTAGLISYGNRRCYEDGNFQEAELVGRRLTDLILPTRQDTIQASLDATLAGQQVDNMELPVVLADGHIGQFSINLSPMRDEQGNVNSIVVVMTDVTDAALLKAKLMHTEKMAAVGQLVSGVAHEVNNPLTAVLGFADLMLEQPDMPESAKKDLRIILQEAQRTKQIVQNLLSFARQMPPQRHSVQINTILDRTLALRSYDFANHDVEVIKCFDDKLPEIVGDAHQLQQVFLNILNNAYDAVRESGRAGRIEICSSSTEDHAEVLFKDNGSGIANPDRIFDPFFTTKEVGKGTGLGLSICYGIVREHGGEVTCHNNPEGEGATFVVRFPITSEAALAAAGASS